MEFLKELLQAILLAAITAGIGYFCTWVTAKIRAIAEQAKTETSQKVLYILADIVNVCVTATNQTYVEELKNKDMFDAEAQKIALKKTYEAVKNALSEEVQKHLKDVVGDDLESFLIQQIESTVAQLK